MQFDQHSGAANKSIVATSHQKVGLWCCCSKKLRMGDGWKRRSKMNVGKQPKFITAEGLSTSQIRLSKSPEVNEFLDCDGLQC